MNERIMHIIKKLKKSAEWEKVFSLLQSVKDEEQNNPLWFYEVGLALYHSEKEAEAVPYLGQALNLLRSADKNDADKINLYQNISELLKDCRRIRNFLANPIQQPLEYYEEKSYMFAVVCPGQENFVNKQSVIQRLKKMFDITIIKDIDYATVFSLQYKGQYYEVEIYPDEVLEAHKNLKTRQYFSQQEQENLINAQYCIAIVMDLTEKYKEGFHLQLKLLNAAVPNLLAVIDESGEQIFSGKWVQLAAQSQVLPPPKMFFNIQAVIGEDDKVWLHTHGLARCHKPELEILNVTQENYQGQYNVLEVLSYRFLDYSSNIEQKSPVFLAQLANNILLVVTVVSWIEGVKKFPCDITGGILSRKYSHNTNSYIIFVYPNKDCFDAGDYYELSLYDDLLNDNPVYMISNEETNRMKQLALERISFIKKIAEKHPEYIHLKIGLKTDTEENDGDKEYLWFVLKKLIDDDIFEAELINEPYLIENLHKGDINIYNVSQITDWEVCAPAYKICPDDVYMLDDLSQSRDTVSIKKNNAMFLQ